MSAITSLGGSTALQGVTTQQHHRGSRGGGPIETAAKALGLSTDDLKSQLSSGKSLGDVADAQGVSRDDLAAALKADAPSGMKNSSDVDPVVADMIDEAGGPKGPKGPKGPPPSGPPPGSGSGDASGVLSGSLTEDQQSTLDSLSSLLGTDSDTLMSRLQSGSSLSDMVSSAGVSASSLAGVVQNGLLFDAKA